MSLNVCVHYVNSLEPPSNNFITIRNITRLHLIWHGMNRSRKILSELTEPSQWIWSVKSKLKGEVTFKIVLLILRAKRYENKLLPQQYDNDMILTFGMLLMMESFTWLDKWGRSMLLSLVWDTHVPTLKSNHQVKS